MNAPLALPTRDSRRSGVRLVTGYTRVRYTIEGRLAELVIQPSAIEAGEELGELPDTRTIDVWNADLARVPEQTRVTCLCPACLEPGEACNVCRGSNRIVAHVVVRVHQRFQVSVAGEGAARERHVDVSEPADFEQTEWPNQLVHRAWYRQPPAQLTKSLRPRINPRYERIHWVQVQAFVG